MTDPLPSPGSDEALARGCICPVLDNGRGRGFPMHGRTVFWIRDDCPLHGSQQETQCPTTEMVTVEPGGFSND